MHPYVLVADKTLLRAHSLCLYGTALKPIFARSLSCSTGLMIGRMPTLRAIFFPQATEEGGILLVVVSDRATHSADGSHALSSIKGRGCPKNSLPRCPNKAPRLYRPGRKNCSSAVARETINLQNKISLKASGGCAEQAWRRPLNCHT